MKQKSFYPIYLYQFLYIIAATLTAVVHIRSATLIIASVSFIVFFLTILLLTESNLALNKSTFYVFLVFICFFIASNFHKAIDKTSLMAVLFLIITYFYIKNISISKHDFLKFVNITYISYLTVSILLYLVFYTNIDSANQFIIDLGIVSIKTLIGISGTTANIDSYTVFVLIVNIMYGKKNKTFIFFLILMILWTDRMTPLIALIIGLFAYYVVRNKSMGKLFIFLFFTTLLVVFYFVYNYHNIEVYGSRTLSNILFYATHGRNIIWEYQLQNIIEHFSLIDWLFGNLHYAKVEVYWSDNLTENSHNSYLFNFFHFGLFYIFILIAYLIKYFNNFDRKSFTILITIFTAALTNSEILIPYNPIFLLTLICLLFIKKENKYENY